MYPPIYIHYIRKQSSCSKNCILLDNFLHNTNKGGFMNIDIRKNIINNFKDAGIDEIKASIVSSIHDGKEITLPGLGVFFELLWKDSDENSKEYILSTIKKGLE